MTGRGRGVRARKIEKPRPLRSQSTSSASCGKENGVANVEDNGRSDIVNIRQILDDIDLYIMDEQEMEKLCSMLSLKGLELEKNCADDMNALFIIFREAIRSSHVSPMIRCLLLELLELRSQRWGKPDPVVNYYETKKRELENFNIMALQARKRPSSTSSVELKTSVHPVQQKQTSENIEVKKSVTKKRECPETEDNNWEPAIENLSLQSNASSASPVSSVENMDISNGTITASTQRARGRGSRRSSRSSEGSVIRQKSEDLPVVGRPSRASIKSEADEVFDSVDGHVPEAAEAVQASTPSAGDGEGDSKKKDARVTLSIAGEVLTISCPNKVIIEGVHKLVLRYRTSLERYLTDGVLDTATERKLYGGQGYFMPKRIRTSSNNGSEPPRDHRNYSRENSQSEDIANTNDSTSTDSFFCTPVVAKVVEAIEGYQDKKKEDLTYDAGLDFTRTKWIERVSGIVRDDMGYSFSQGVTRQPITPTSSLAYITKIEAEQKDGSNSSQERRKSFSKTSQRYWSKMKQESLVKEGETPATPITYPKDFLLSCGTSAIATKPPSFCDWDSLMREYKEVCMEKVSNIEVAMRIFNFSTWKPETYTGFRSSAPPRDRERQTSGYQREYPQSADNTRFTRPGYEVYTRSRSYEERSNNMRPWDIGKSSDPQGTLPQSEEWNSNRAQTGRRYSGPDQSRKNSWPDARQNPSSFRDFNLSTGSKDFDFGRNYGTTTSKFSADFSQGKTPYEYDLGLLLEENTRIEL